MDFKQLESFVSVVTRGSFSNAAERLQISQSMVTIHIRNLEAELGTRLINRTTRSMELSHDGRTFYYYARQMLRLNRDSLFALTRADQDERAINIVATPYTSRYYLSTGWSNSAASIRTRTSPSRSATIRKSTASCAPAASSSPSAT